MRYVHSTKKAWCNLADAIIESAIKENDTEFFESEWYELLRDLSACRDTTYPGVELHLSLSPDRSSL